MRRFFDTLALLLAAAAAGCSATPPADYPPAGEPAIAEVAPAPAATPETAPGGDPAEAGGDAADEAADDAPAAAPAKRAGKGEPAQAAAEITGTLVGRNGKEVTVELSAAPPVGAKGSLLKRFDQEIGPIKATGWLGIADVSVKKVDGRKVVLAIEAEKSDIVLNGKKLDHYTSGAQVKLELAP